MALVSLNSTNWYDYLSSNKDLIGGVNKIELWQQVYDSVTATNAVAISSAIASNHDIVIPTANYPSAPAPVTIKFAPEQSTLTVSTSQESGLALHTCSIEGFIPNINATNMGGLQALVGKNLMGIVTLLVGKTIALTGNDTLSGSRTKVLLGWDNILGDKTDVSGTDHLTSKFALFLESIEVTSGTAMSDNIGATVKLTAVQGELPRQVVTS